MEYQNKESSKSTNELNSYKQYLIYRLGICMSERDRIELLGEYYELSNRNDMYRAEFTA